MTDSTSYPDAIADPRARFSRSVSSPRAHGPSSTRTGRGIRRAVRNSRHVSSTGTAIPILDGMVEIWQANAAGRYAHPGDARTDIPLEEGFVGFGRSGTVNDGSFEFVTVKPGRVPAPDGELQAPHLVVLVFARGLLKQLVTRLYFPDEDGCERLGPDPLRARRGRKGDPGRPARRNGGLRFDIHLQGDGRATFFARMTNVRAALSPGGAARRCLGAGLARGHARVRVCACPR